MNAAFGLPAHVWKGVQRLTALIVISGFATTAIPQDSFDYRIANIQILQSRAVQHELGVSVAQRAAMNRAAAGNRPKVQNLLARAKSSGTKPNAGQLTDLYVELRSQVLAQLTAGQLRRLRELTIQSAGTAAVTDPVVAKRLELSEAQVVRTKAAYEKGAKEAAQLRKEEYDPIVAPYRSSAPKTAADAKRLHAVLDPKLARAEARLRPRLRSLEERTNAAVLEVLTAAQRAAWHAINGKAFRVK